MGSYTEWNHKLHVELDEQWQPIQELQLEPILSGRTGIVVEPVLGWSALLQAEASRNRRARDEMATRESHSRFKLPSSNSAQQHQEQSQAD